MKKNNVKASKTRLTKKLDPNEPAQRKQIIKKAVKRTIDEYGEALKRLGSE